MHAADIIKQPKLAHSVEYKITSVGVDQGKSADVMVSYFCIKTLLNKATFEHKMVAAQWLYS